VRVGIVGAGPAGLYLAILLRRADPASEVTVFERNPPGATYGWGVVFSEESLLELRDADYDSYQAMDEALVRWSAIDIHYRGEVVRSVGHGFSAIARTELLRILQERAAGLGVQLCFESPVAEPGATEALVEADLVVGADGVRSVVRDAAPAAFGTTFTPHRSRYVWFGADLAFPVFTFIFRPTEHGLFQVHSYPFDAHRSTFIVECTEATWRAAGLDAMGEQESLAFCQDLFAPQLGEHRLLSNRSVWSTFVTVRNRSWWHGNTVLVGDAAHTAHFSIGSGTRLALDDAIALAEALGANKGDLVGALAAYEGERHPVVERFQEVATDSAHYFESVSRYLSFDSEQFAFNLLTRSGRITHLNLEQRDPALVNRVDGWFAGRSGRLVSVPPLLVPLHLGGLELANRVVLAPTPGDEAEEGLVGEEERSRLVEAAVAGAALVVTGPVAPSPGGRITSGSGGLWSDDHQEAWAAVVRAVHDEGARLALRLSHAGRRGATRPRRLGLDRPLPRRATWPLLAPSPLPYAPGATTPVEMDRVAMDAVTAAFAAAARTAAAAGFDLLLLDWSDGYLLAEFLSPLANRRTDTYGGDLTNRARFPLEVLDAVAASWGDRPLGVRLVTDDRASGGLEAADGVALARLAAGGGAALVDVTAGHTTADERGAPDYRRLFNLALADRVRNEAGVPTLASGHITRLDEVNTILAAGRADLCLVDPSVLQRRGA
jgi:anthraniloyl-CoA monooxygenase